MVQGFTLASSAALSAAENAVKKISEMELAGGGGGRFVRYKLFFLLSEHFMSFRPCQLEATSEFGPVFEGRHLWDRCFSAVASVMASYLTFLSSISKDISHQPCIRYWLFLLPVCIEDRSRRKLLSKQCSFRVTLGKKVLWAQNLL